jgi:predicted metal-dependent hydrolase
LPGGEAVGEDDDALERALDDAALLFDAGLYFEVHEVLEPHWQQASGQMREALQGLIQIAVGYQHLANGNVRGARSLLADGAARITARVIKGRPLRRFAQQVLESAASSPASIPPFPRTA